MRDVKQARLDAMFQMAERGGTENEREQARKWIETKTGETYSEAVKKRGAPSQESSRRPGTVDDFMQDMIDNMRRAAESAWEQKWRNPHNGFPSDFADRFSRVKKREKGENSPSESHSDPYPPWWSVEDWMNDLRDSRQYSNPFVGKWGPDIDLNNWTKADEKPRHEEKRSSPKYPKGDPFESYRDWAHGELPVGISPGPLFVTDMSGLYNRMDGIRKAEYEKWKAQAGDFGLVFLGEDRRDY
jgi:hypothetical protein